MLVFVQPHHLFCSSSPFVCFVHPHHFGTCFICSSSQLFCFVHPHCLFVLFIFTACLLCSPSLLVCFVYPHHSILSTIRLEISLISATACCQSPLVKGHHVVRVPWAKHPMLSESFGHSTSCCQSLDHSTPCCQSLGYSTPCCQNPLVIAPNFVRIHWS